MLELASEVDVAVLQANVRRRNPPESWIHIAMFRGGSWSDAGATLSRHFFNKRWHEGRGTVANAPHQLRALVLNFYIQISGNCEGTLCGGCGWGSTGHTHRRGPSFAMWMEFT